MRRIKHEGAANMVTTRRKTILQLLLLILLAGMYVVVSDIRANDAPHDITYSISCTSNCHIPAGTGWQTQPTPAGSDQTAMNNMCTSCHVSSNGYGMSQAMWKVATHSSNMTSTQYSVPAGSGTPWIMDCRTCHDPHTQKQIADNPSDATAFLQIGAITAVASNVITVNATLTPSAWVGYEIVPNYVANPSLYYRITGNTANTITVSAMNPFDTTYTIVGSNFAIRYPNLVKDQIINPTTSVSQTVVFYNNSGNNSFATTAGPITGVCQVCHTQTKYFQSNGSVYGNSHNGAETQCTKCHTHDQGFKASCGACHGQPPTLNTLGTNGLAYVSTTPVYSTGSQYAGAHAAHVSTAGLSCFACHDNNTATGSHNNGSFKIQIGFNTPGGGGGNYDGQSTASYTADNPLTTVGKTGTMKCSSVYCHSSGQGTTSMASTPVYTTPVWNNAATGQCGSCHGVNWQTLASGNHSQHLNYIGTANSPISGCADCHTGAPNGNLNGSSVYTSYTGTNHVNGKIDVADGYNMGGAPGNGYGTCTTATGCHGSASPQWGTPTTNVNTCTICHGTVTTGSTSATSTNDAPGWNVAHTSNSPTDPQVGAHQIHLVSSTFFRAIACTECHPNVTAVNSPGHLNSSGTASVTFLASAIATSAGLSPQYAAGVCNNVYCHGAKILTPTGNYVSTGTTTKPSWVDTNYVNGTSAHDCAQCHGYPPTGVNGHTSSNTCNSCHTHVNSTNDGFLASGFNLHINGAVDVNASDCYSCHGSSSASKSTGAPFVTADLVNSAGSNSTGHTVGAHPKHVGSVLAYSTNCNICHDQNGMPSPDSKITVSFNLANSVNGNSLPSGGTYTGISFGAQPFSYNPASIGIGSSQSCANYCHSQGTSSGPTFSSPVTPAVWTGSAMPTDCTGCHGNDINSASAINSGTHTKHINNAAVIGTNYTCDKCHSATVASNTTRALITGSSSSHLNGVINVQFSGMSGTYGTNGMHAPGAGYTNCTNLYCHSNGKGTYSTMAWNGAGIGCNGCHGVSNSQGYPDYVSNGSGSTKANSHAMHVVTRSISCSTCHIQTTTDGLSIALTATTHIDQNTQNVSFNTASAGASASYNTTNKTCSITCHGVEGAYGTPQWGGTMTCASCHGFPPATGAHLTHIQSSGLLSITAYGQGDWFANKSDTNNYAFGCGNCHPATNVNHENGTVVVALSSTGVTTGLRAKNDPSAAYSIASPNGSNLGTCNAVYCHSNSAGSTAGNLTTAVSPSWNDTMAKKNSGNTCNGCHGNPPSYGSVTSGGAGANSHYTASSFMGKEGGHMVTVHFDNVSSKVTSSGTLTWSTNVESAHGNNTVATTMGCAACHAGTASSTSIDTYAMNGTGSTFQCSRCHNGTTPTKTVAGAIFSKANHVNGKVDVQFMSSPQFNIKAQLRNVPTASFLYRASSPTYGSAGSYDYISNLNSGSSYSSTNKTCTNDCHLQQPATWGDQTVTCLSCHTTLP
jgi:predicted CxxxxCH...CXXCH cytochrome family protein